MDFRFSAEDETFRAAVRAFLAEAVTPETRAKVRRGETLTHPERLAWFAKLNARGWMAPGWPQEYGGAEWSPMQRMIFDEACGEAWAPAGISPGVVMLGPILIAFGNEEQKTRYLPRILSSEDWWCQGYSEPGSGSDLASLQTRAVREGDAYVVSGQKIWITQADAANMMFCLVRTSSGEKKQEGISFLLIDMRSPGIAVRPIRTLSNEAEICEVFLDDVRVPVENLVGREGEGWTYATQLLEHERSAVGNINRGRAALARVRDLAGVLQRGAATLLDDPVFAQRLARLEIRLRAAQFMQLRAVSAATAGQRPGRESSLLKIVGSELMQEIAHLTMTATGYASIEQQSPATKAYFDSRKLSIFSGANEIQRNIVAKRILGL
jgi:alkylation response protein AidB-like acyl-CoA dehydrogenase